MSLTVSVALVSNKENDRKSIANFIKKQIRYNEIMHAI